MTEPRDEMKDYKAYLRTAVERNLPKIDGSAIFLAILTKEYAKDSLAVLQFGLAILLDKPIYLLIQKGQVLPENVKRLARGIEEITGPEDVGFAAERLMASARQAGFFREED